ncbi:MAG: DUF4340 domain-containing protein [Polyangiales bacterium]
MEWRRNRIAIGALAFFVLLGLTLWAANSRNRPASDEGEIPRIELEKGAITTLEITRPPDDRVVLTKVDGSWRVKEPVDAAADQNNVDSALNRLGDLKIRRIVSSTADNYVRLQVDDASAVQVVAKAGENTVARLKIGKYGDGITMIRIDDREQVFGASGSLRYAFDRELKAWRNRQVVNVSAGDVESIRFASGNGIFLFQREGEGWTALEGQKALGEFDSKQVTGRVSTAARLTASDFAPEETSAARAGLTEPTATVTMTLTGDSDAIVLELGDSADPSNARYLRRQGDPTIYLVSQHLAERLQPGPTAFEAPKAPPVSPPAMPKAPPGDMQQPQLPPEVMRQLQEQIRAQQQQQ